MVALCYLTIILCERFAVFTNLRKFYTLLAVLLVASSGLLSTMTVVAAAYAEGDYITDVNTAATSAGNLTEN